MISNDSTARQPHNHPRPGSLAMRLLMTVLAAAMTVACLSNPPRTDVKHVVNPGEDLKAIAVKYTGSPDNERAIAARSGILNPHNIKAGDTVTIPANLLTKEAAGATAQNPVAVDANRTIAEAMAAGAALGAIGGAVGCRKNAASCAGLGAGVGALAGLAGGLLMVAAKEAFATDEARLDQEIAHAEQFNQKLQTHNTELEAEVARLSAECKRLQQRARRDKSLLSQLSAQREQVSKLLASSQKLLTDSRNEIARQEQAYNGFQHGKTASNPKVGKFNAAITTGKGQIERTTRATADLAALSSRLSV